MIIARSDGIALFNWKWTYYNIIITKQQINDTKNGCFDQQDRIESSELNTHIYKQWIFDKDWKTLTWEMRFSSIIGNGKILFQTFTLHPIENIIPMGSKIQTLIADIMKQPWEKHLKTFKAVRKSFWLKISKTQTTETNDIS